MADDLDDLLDEVESKFIKKKASTTEKKKPQPSSKPKSKADEDLDAMIDDICDGPDPPEKMKTSSARKTGKVVSSAQGKCFPVYLGGSEHSMGLASSMTQRTCDKLRCTDCDFRIVHFDNFAWDSTVDYLFLRNNVPEFSKLRSKLSPKRGCRAYACQCKWKNIRELENIQKYFDLKWVCGRH